MQRGGNGDNHLVAEKNAVYAAASIRLPAFTMDVGP
jgi:hypothetical protein